MARMSCVVVLAVTVLLASGAALAGPTDQGSRELSGSFAWVTESYSYKGHDLGSQTALGLTPGFGYFVADGFEIKVNLPVTFTSYDLEYYRSDYSQTTIGTHVIGLYHFGASETFAPFVGAGLGARWAFDSEDGDYETLLILPSVHVGARAFFSETACLTTEIVYSHQSNARHVEDVAGNVFGMAAGFSVFFE